MRAASLDPSLRELGDEFFGASLGALDRRYKETQSSRVREEIESYVERLASVQPCPECQGARLRKESLAIRVGGLNIAEVTRKSVKEAAAFFGALGGRLQRRPAGPHARRSGRSPAGFSRRSGSGWAFLINVGLDYLTLDRTAATLAGGEGQRIRLATQIGSSLMGVLYILDEPSIGLHQRDNVRLLNTLKRLRDLGNTVLVVEHDEETIRAADYVIDLGPGAGVAGGTAGGRRGAGSTSWPTARR